MSNSFWIILASFLVAANAGLLGNFLILRRQAMIGDAISHAVLPGIAIAFMLTNSMHPLVLFVGASVASMLATLLISFFERKVGVAADVGIGITFTTFFACGIVLISLYTQKADLDQQCVLYGHPILIPFELWAYDIPKAVYLLGGLLLMNTVFISICYHPLLITSFDPHFAQVIGMRTIYWHYLLMVFTALTTVSAFRIVGAVLVIAFLVIPSATAYLLTEGLKRMLFYTLCIDVVVAWAGYHLAYALNSSIAGAMVTIAGIGFLLALGISHIKEKRNYDL